MSKIFAKVNHTRVTKNKLQSIILNELKTVDATLFPDRKTAKKHIEDLYNNAVETYKGKAAPQKLVSFEPNSKTLNYHVEDVISLSLYDVKIDLT
ncbi:hypothetical protein [Flavobacterium gelatinilyticum]|uniref:hypothetical protein n=1 Tax=Flavobacterium gelatinilyticum TaxID=3003260 RepID=UPI00248027C4|nr:hypothetical protein [Flavobacterium gelatinilyticum]